MVPQATAYVVSLLLEHRVCVLEEEQRSAVSVGQAETVAEADCVVGEAPTELLAMPVGGTVVAGVESGGAWDGELGMLGPPNEVGGGVGTLGDEPAGLEFAVLELASIKLLEPGVDTIPD